MKGDVLTVTANNLGGRQARPQTGVRPPANVAELVGYTLARLGGGHVFGVVGSGNFTVTNALRRPASRSPPPGTKAAQPPWPTPTAGCPARVGIVSTHQGCGLTNAVTGIGEAAKSRTPMIVLTADTAASAIRSNFKIDQDALARSVGAVAERIHSPASAMADTVRAFRTAVNERRTVVLSLPTDIQAAAVLGRPGRDREPLRRRRQSVRPPHAASRSWPD